jgi:hypothetical protein
MAPGLFIATANTGSGFLLVNLFFFQLSFELDCEHVCSQLMALGLLIAIAVYWQWFFPC